MKTNCLPLVLGLVLGIVLPVCGYGLYDDRGAPTPGPDYWGWRCRDGTPVPDGGCLPQTCADSSTPAASDGGSCTCADGTRVDASGCRSDAG